MKKDKKDGKDKTLKEILNGMLELIEKLKKCIDVQTDLNSYRLEDWKKMDKDFGLYLDDEDMSWPDDFEEEWE